MNTKTRILILALLMLGATRASAVEGALGRPISGAGVNPYAGLVPPEPGWLFSVGEMYYQGDIGGNLATPIGGNLALGLDLKASFTTIGAVYIWDTHSPCWNFASGVTVPLVWLEAEADVTVGNIVGHRKDSASGLFDIAFSPIVASYHVSQTEHVSFGLTVWAPTGDYEVGQLANVGLNNWTFIPTIGYTKLIPSCNVELSASWGMEFYTENPDTDYQNGVVSDLEVMAVKRFKNGLGVGIIGSWIEQVTDDDGTVADALNGFKGRAFGVGPIVTYSTKIGETHLDLNARWVHEFENERRFEGDLFAFNLGLKF